jgi:hypothetical protein
MATTAMTSPLDPSAVKQAIDLVHKGRQGEATDVEGTISDLIARKLVEWVILHGEDGSSEFSRYAAFITANPSWPGIETMRRRAEAVIWQENTDPQAVIDFFRASNRTPPKGTSRWRGRCSRGATYPAPRRFYVRRGETTALPAISKPRRAGHSPV